MIRILSLVLGAAAVAGASSFPVTNPAQLEWKPKDALPPGAHGALVAAIRTSGPTLSSAVFQPASPYRCTGTRTTSLW